MITFFGYVAYFLALIISFRIELLTLLGNNQDRPISDWIYAALVILIFFLETPSYVYKPAFLIILLATLIRSILEYVGWYTSGIERIDSGICLLLIIMALIHGIHTVVTESL
jgi:hypothetical protein